ncbi:MAG: hypothetical protein H7Z74_03415 [Anaerolineae bacterium]|nr:hypothetical protein [Gemmatimonadaceae bacterium]
MAASCISSTQQYFVPTAGQERIDSGGLRSRGDALLAAECPRLRGDKESDNGAADFTITVDREGYVTRARLDRSSGDERIDQLFGGLTAALQFDPPASTPGVSLESAVTLAYACSPTVAAITFQIKQPGGDSVYVAPPPTDAPQNPAS